jgi:hypothetical protein
MGMFTLAFNTDNEAFENAPYDEPARILRLAADAVEDAQESGKIRDINGNTIGRWQFDD